MIELNKIYNEDCLEGMKRIPDGSVDLTVEQAINEIENELYYMECVRIATNPTKKEYALQMAKVALSKEIPKVPYTEPERGYYGMGYFYNTRICPHCKRDIEPAGKGRDNFSKK